jgi:putative sterol carrier protein
VFVGISTAEDFGTQIRQIYHFTPVPGGEILLRVGFSANLQTMPADIVEEVQARNLQMLEQNFREDETIWKYKRYLISPVLCQGDGPFGVLRRWTRQFYPVHSDVRGETTTRSAVQEIETAADITYADVEGPASESEQGTPPTSTNRGFPPSHTGTPLTVHDTIFKQLPASFNAAATKGREFVIQYYIRGDAGGKYFVSVRDGVCTPAEGEHSTPSVTVSVNADDWLQINAGTLKRAKAFLTGRLKVGGDMALAYQLDQIFRS